MHVFGLPVLYALCFLSGLSAAARRGRRPRASISRLRFSAAQASQPSQTKQNQPWRRAVPDAFAGVHARRPCILPSDGLFQELVRLEKQVTGEGKASMTAFDYNVYQLASVTTQPVAKCRHALEKAGGDVNRAMNSLFG